MKKNIATHRGIFHADEVTAVAILKVFTDDEIVVERIEHQTTDFSAYDMVIDVGRVFDGVKHFDHHQYQGGKSSAGLIWDTIDVRFDYPKISKLVKMIDDNDVGLVKAKEFEFSSLVKMYNHKNIYSNEQDRQFDKAVKFVMTVLISMKEGEEAIWEAKEIVKNSYLFDRNPKILELEKFTPHWTNYINGFENAHIKAVVWEDEEDGTYKVKIPSKRVGSFELNGKAMKQDKSMNFVHSAGFFAIAKDRDTMSAYLKKHFS